MVGLALRVTAWIGSLASVIGLVVTIRPAGSDLTFVHGGLIGFATIGFVGLMCCDAVVWWREQPQSFRRQADIDAYMYEWISSGGRVVIFTRDMTWAGGAAISQLLRNKAARGELTIVLPEVIPLAEDLASAGATIVAYDKLKFVPESRFTIINYDRMDARLAVGRRIKDRHVIEEFAAGEHPVFAIAKDLIGMLTCIPKSYRTKSQVP